MKMLPAGTGTVRTALTQNELECAVDEYGVAEVLAALSRICGEKANHLEENWQDAQSAQWWNARAEAIDKLAAASFMRDAD